ncbi:hypothetical protein GCM10023323_10170 [Streptomyces thinghirensis]|uniref:Uncharacterized protein n=1 Tax=Streptomyces thinghirensis TaxID=551547 RepID=A0ABP9SZ82_9ACTN
MSDDMRAPEVGSQWILWSGTKRIGTLQLSEIDQPWFRCDFTPGDSWQTFSSIFERLSAAVDRGADGEVSEAFREFLSLKLRLTAKAQYGPDIEPVILQIRDGKVAVFRY